jgi:hypothetical protein
MRIAGIHVFPFLKQKLYGFCEVCNRGMEPDKGYFFTYKLYSNKTRYKFFCSKDCLTLYGFQIL